LAVFGKPRYLGLVNIGEPLPETERWVVIKTLRGLELGVLGGTLSQEQEAKYRTACLDEAGDEHTRGPEPLLQEVEFVEAAGGARMEEYCRHRSEEENVLIRSRQILTNHRLPMKLVDVEYTLDRKKLFFYFTSEQRVDFRAYVRDLAKEFHIRIEMRQIGVRDEARTVRGIAPCGRPCCCSHWLHRFTPINIRMVKEQNLVLNPTKISGICGRLMCCMAYEHSTYSRLWRSLPSPGSKIRTPQGNYVLEGVDLRTEMVRVRFPEGREVGVPVAEFPDFKEAVLAGKPWKEEAPAELAHSGSILPAVSHGRPPVSRSPVSKLPVARLPVPKAEPPRAARSPKPEKISIEEHLAERELSRRPGLEKADGEEAVFLKKRGKKRRAWSDGKPSAVPGPARRTERERENPREYPKSAKPRESARFGDPRVRLDGPARQEAPRSPNEVPRDLNGAPPRALREPRARQRGRRPRPGGSEPQTGKEGS
jgi:cell fate regulator YaaT (PSP1 superfamily)